MKRKFSRFRFYFINILLGLVIFGIVVFALLFVLCRTKKVSMEGTTLYATEDLEAYLLDGPAGTNALFATVVNRFTKPEDIPFLQEAKISMTGYNSILIKVKEKEMIGCLQLESGEYAYFDGSGKVVEVSQRLLSDRIMVGGVTLKDAKIGEQVDIDKKQLDYLTALLEALRKYDVPVTLASLEENGGISVLYGTILISMGTQDDLEEKVMRLPKILPQLEGQSGILHLENWTKDNTDIVFEKQTQT